jgi:hemin uptake protein HemP
VQNPNDRDKPTATSGAAPPRLLTSRELFGSGNRVDIEHQGEIYRLQITRLGRLILTK